MLNFWLFYFINSLIMLFYYVDIQDKAPDYIEYVYTIVFYCILPFVAFVFYIMSKNRYIRYYYLTNFLFCLVFNVVNYTLTIFNGYYLNYFAQELQIVLTAILSLNYKHFFNYAYKLDSTSLYNEENDFIIYKKYPITYYKYLIAFFGAINPGYYSVAIIHKGYLYGFKKGVYVKKKLNTSILKRFDLKAYKFNKKQIQFLENKVGDKWTNFDNCHITVLKCLKMGDKNG